MESFTFDAALPGGQDAPRRARELIRPKLAGRIPLGRIEEVELLVTELVTNSVRHGGAGPRTGVRVHVEGGPAAPLRIEVADPGRRRDDIAPRPPRVDEGGGFGLFIVDQVASRWGVADGPRTCVWFELDCG